MSMSIPELERALRSLRLSGMIATLEARALQVAHHETDFIEAFSALVQDELDRRRSRLLERRFSHSGLPERKDLKDFDWSYNPRLPKREILELATLKFIDAHEGALFLGPPGLGKSHVAKALAQLAVSRGYKVLYREAHQLIDDIHEARELGELRKYRQQLNSAELLLVDDLFLRKLPPTAGEELADVIMSRYEKRSMIITSNRPVDDWGKLLGDVVVVTPLLAHQVATRSGSDRLKLERMAPRGEKAAMKKSRFSATCDGRQTDRLVVLPATRTCSDSDGSKLLMARRDPSVVLRASSRFCFILHSLLKTSGH